MPGSDFRRRSRNGRTSAASRSAAAGSSPPSTAVAYRVRNVPRRPSRPGVVQSRIAHSSVRLFSTGVPVRATRAREGIVRNCLAVAACGFLTCCASSMTTMPQAAPASRGASSRIVPYVVRTNSPSARPSSERDPPWKRRTGVPGANFSISRCQLPIRDVGHTTSVGPAASRSVCRCRCSAMRVIVLPSPMSSARQPPSPSDVIVFSQFSPRNW